MIKSFVSAFLMYSRIPMPRVEWKEENHRYSLCFFPFIGAVIGGLFLLWRYICIQFEINTLIFGAVGMVIPIAVTGGIHLDGFCDVSDARASCADKDRKLQIMSDSHIGAFAAIKLVVYLILQTALFSGLCGLKCTAIAACGFILSRALSAIAAITFRCAKNNGTLQSFVRPSYRKITIAVLSIITILTCGGMILIVPISGCAAIAAAFLTMLYYRHVSYREFGGITGDLAGWFLQICEIMIAAAVVFSEKAAEVIK